MQRLLIANRSEIARRIARSARERGLETVGVFAPEDAALAREYGTSQLAALPGAGPSAYLDVDALVRVASEQGCDALHPGYGFASERPALARACEAAGLRFVGPSADTLERFGDKASARTLAQRLGVPVLDGSSQPVDLDALREFRARLPEGTSLVLKAVAGGGGRGMRIVAPGEDLAAALARCRSEAHRAFGVEAVIAERHLAEARHVEVQVAGDRAGTIVVLGDRECSLQRRHQKLIERAPATGVSDTLRATLHDAARAIAREAGLEGLGTIEFLLDAQGGAFFLEANPRLQVEHTITEEVTGVDLVGLQLDLAAGRSLDELGLAVPPRPRGHAIQLRLLAETIAEDGTPIPTTATIESIEWPRGAGIRIETAIRPGLAPSPAFDSLLAKLVVACADPDPDRCLRRARTALDELAIVGPETNADLLAVLLERPEWADDAITTGLFDRACAALVAAARERRARRAQDAPSGAGATGTEAAARENEAALPPGLAPLRSSLPGTVVEIAIRPGAEVALGEPVCVVESMKMEHVFEAPRAGRIERVCVAPGEVVAIGTLLLAIEPSGADDRHENVSEDRDPAAIRPDLAAVRARHALLEDASRPEAVARRRSRGQRTARENLAALADPDSFVEYGALAVAAMRRTRPLEELARRTPGDAILTGFGTVNAGLFGAEAARCAMLVTDATVLAGTQGYFHHHKIDRLLELAGEARTPIVFLPEGGGGRPNDSDTSDLVVAGLDVTSFHAWARLSGRVPRIGVVSGFCFAGSAAFAGCSDVLIATRGASLGMGGPAMIEGGGLGRVRPEEVGPSEALASAGVVDVLVDDEAQAVEVARRTLAYFQGATADWRCADQRRLRTLVPENRRRVYDVRAVIETLCDLDSVLELRRAWGPGLVTALVRLEGRPFGLIANDPTHLGGAIDDLAAEKAARFLQLCDAFGLPILSLCDTPGFMVGPEIERRAHVRKTARLFLAGATLSVPVVTIVLRKAYGLGAQAMAGGSFRAPFLVAAWPTGEIGGMGLEGAIELGFRKQLDAQPTEAARRALFEKLVGALYEKGKAINAASQLELDAVIDPAETRATILRALTAFGPIRGSNRPVDAW